MVELRLNVYSKSSVMTQHIIARIAIYLLSAIMVVFGIYHFLYPRNLLLYVPPNLPIGINWVYIVGVAFILAAIAFILNRGVKLAGYLLAAMLLLFVVLIHIPNYREAGDEVMRQGALINALKDMAIAAFALHIAGSADARGMKY
jgi:putative oxidoreductase